MNTAAREEAGLLAAAAVESGEDEDEGGWEVETEELVVLVELEEEISDERHGLAVVVLYTAHTSCTVGMTYS